MELKRLILRIKLLCLMTCLNKIKNYTLDKSIEIPLS